VKSVRCQHCGRVLGKLDEDGSFHVRIGKDGPQIFVNLKDLAESHLMLVCPSFVYTPAGKVKCGTRHAIGIDSLN